MLTLTPGSACDVCAEEYGPHCQPHSIPCGHVLCASCCSTIVEKTASRLMPVCPFCREQFSNDSVRLIRTDFSSSGWTTPRRLPTIESNHVDFADMWARKTERLLSDGGSKTREARRLEDKVAKVAAKKCSVEEVSTLHKELEAWLTSEVKDDQTSLLLSAALLRAILMNHLAHSEASRNAKTIEANLKSKLDDMEINNGKLEAELRKQRLQNTQKTQECQTLRTELSRLKALATTLGTIPTDARQSTSPPTSPTPYSTPTSPLSRFNSVHVRSASMSSRPSTPASAMPSPARSHTPAPPPARSHTPAPPLRSHTPAPPPARSQTPSIRSQTPSIRSYTPAPQLRHPTPGPLRMQTPAPPPIPPKPRRLSTPSPPKMMRSTSEEKAEIHERWLPPEHDYQKNLKYSRPPSRMASHGISSTAAAAARFRETRSPSPS